jgi:GH24 family phage-related lysozyme (muramidase)
VKTSEEGLRFIMQQEGCVLHPYEDVVGNLTIGVGHLIVEGEEFPDRITEAEALDLLAKDVARFEEAVNSHNLDLSQAQFDALVDFSFNCGEGALAKLLSHGLDAVPNQLPLWNKAGGRVIGALVRRRAAEVEMWNS